MKHAQVKRLTYVSAAATLGAVGLMVLSIVSPKPLYLVFAMSVGQGLGTLSLAAYLLAVVLDLQGGAGIPDAVAEADEEKREDASHS